MSSGCTENLLGRLEPSPKVRVIFEGVSYALFAILTLLQLGLLDYYFIKYTENEKWYAWVAGDVVVVATLVWLLVLSIRYNHRCFTKNQCEDANIRYAFVGWFFYSMVLSGKIAVSIRLFGDRMHTDQFFGRNVYQINLSLSALIFLLLVLSHHYTQLNSKRQLYLSYLESAVTLDILDSIQFLGFLFSTSTKAQISDAMEITILFFTCFNFVLPTFALLRLRYKRLPPWMMITFQEMYTLIYYLMVNVPFLVIRALVTKQQLDSKIGDAQDNMSTFVIKNVIMIFLGFREFYVALLKRHQEMKEEGRTSQRSVPL